MLKSVEWKAVESTLFTSAAYRADARQLYLRLRDGSIYRYFDFPAEMYKALLDAESRGRYFVRHIRNAFRYELVRSARRHAGAGADRRTELTAARRPRQPA
jgi:hypothetical protein